MTHPKISLSRLKPLALLALGAAAPLVHAAGAWQPTQTAAFSLLDGLASRGELRSGEPVHVTVSLKLRDRAGLDAFIAERQRPGSPAYGQSLSSADFLARYAPTEAQAAQVAAYLTRQGFVNVEIDATRQLVRGDGSAGTATRAFATRLEGFAVGERLAYANTRPAQVPAELAGSVLAVLGLQTVQLAQPTLLPAVPAGSAAPAAVRPDAATATGHYPTEFPALYGVGAVPEATQTSVAIMSAGNIAQTITDLRTFESQQHLPQVPVSQVNVGTPTSDASGVPEWDLDSQDIQGMAGAVKSLVFYVIPTLANDDLTAGFARVVGDNSVKIINVSLGECETGARADGSMAADDQLFAQAVAQGQLFTVSTGDSGSYECGRLRKGQSYPAVSPYVAAIGGTTLYTANGAYASESTWSGGGGGPSSYEPKPAWQTVGAAGYRSVPDYSLDADPNSGAKIVVKGKAAQYGGTSLAAPLFAGVWARVQNGAGGGLPFPNPTLYANAQPKALFNDVTTGSNGQYSATTGWDFATGWGSPKIASVYSLLVGG